MLPAAGAIVIALVAALPVLSRTIAVWPVKGEAFSFTATAPPEVSIFR